ncbi:hypothetical protein EVAR_102520_1 [Eumeta japonica]|uniref:Uncharacterized protein n=1 Tax=Eumeta variegata TaxID=151549 RepID=A0A4C1SKQ2_EUMVA|nr:hypothetical protein EVAR_102520_1 [Eumeta japonica]
MIELALINSEFVTHSQPEKLLVLQFTQYNYRLGYPNDLHRPEIYRSGGGRERVVRAVGLSAAPVQRTIASRPSQTSRASLPLLLLRRAFQYL